MEILIVAKGIRIEDKINRVVSVKLPDILEEIKNGHDFHWAMIELYATFLPPGTLFTEEEEKHIEESDTGLPISWERLKTFSRTIHQEIDLLIIASKNTKLLYNYYDDTKMYETCDIVVEMIDSNFWQVFSKDEELINRLAKKFKEVEFLEPDFER